MKRIILIFTITALFMGLYGQTQQQPLITIDDTVKIYPDEFLYMLKKNTLPNDTITPEQYLQMFINYKLKVLDAIEHGYNKDSNFINEYHKYLLEVARDSFKDKRLEQALLRKYYQWAQTEVNTSYIMKKIPPTATPEDTLKLYNELMDIRKRAISGEDFSKLAMQYSDAPRVKRDKGKAGYLSVYDIPPQFQNFVWTQPVGAVSRPMRFLNSYYLIKITGKRPAKGKYHLAQIFISLPAKHTQSDSIEAYKKLHAIDSALRAGVSFEELAKKYSDDFRSGRNGGDMGWIRPGQTIPKFEEAAFALEKPGDITGPVRTILGFHYIKLIDKQDYSDFDKQKDDLMRLIRRSPQYRKVMTNKLDSLKYVYGFRMLGSMDTIYNHVDRTVFDGKWHDSLLIDNNNPLFELNGQKYTYGNFAKYLEKVQHPTIPENLHNFIDNQFNNFVYDKVKLLYVLDMAKNTNTEFGRLAREFYEGLLLFNISDDKVWQKASEDSLGLRIYYEQNKDKYADIQYITIFKARDQKTLKKAKRLLKKSHKEVIDKSFANQFEDSALVFVKQVVIKKNKNPEYEFIFKELKEKPKQKIFTTDDNQLIFVNDKFNQIRGYIIADYQNYLDQQWIKQLRNKHKVEINYKIFDQITKKTEK